MGSKVLCRISKIKKAFAKCCVLEGKAGLKINDFDLDSTYFPEFFKNQIKEVFRFLPEDFNKKIGLKIFVKGGGISGQSNAIRVVIVKSVLNYFNLNNQIEYLKSNYRHLIVDDKRHKYPKLFLRKGARAKYQLSFR